MERCLLVGLSLLCFFSAGQALQCYYCPYGTCIVPSTVECSMFEICATSTGTVSASIFGLSLTGKGCLNLFSCLSSSTASINGVEYTVSPSCCLGSFCNAGSLARPSMLVGLLTLMATLLMTLL